MTRTLRFITAFLATICIVVAVNAVPYLNTRGAYQRDGQEVAGFPFIFHKVGGDCYPQNCETYNFHVGYFAANTAIGLACAIVIGFAAASSRKGRRRVA
jgi:hypothetical protein